MTRVVTNLQSWGELFTAPPNSQLYTETEPAESTQRSVSVGREYTLYEYLYSSALPLAGAIRETPRDAVEG